MKISIPKPCSKDWNQMTPSEQGRFCASCQTQVVDFKEMPLKEIKAFLEQETDSICARFSTHQLEVFNTTYQELPSPSNLRQWTMAAVLAGLSTLPTFAHNSNHNITIPSPLSSTSIFYSHYQLETTETAISNDTIILTGKVIDSETGEGIIGAYLKIPDTQIIAFTNIFGEFSIQIPKSKEAITLEINSLGYDPISHSIDPNSTKTDLVFSLKEPVLMGMVLYTKKELRAKKRAQRKKLHEERKKERALKKAERS